MKRTVIFFPLFWIRKASCYTIKSSDKTESVFILRSSDKTRDNDEHMQVCSNTKLVLWDIVTAVGYVVLPKENRIKTSFKYLY